MTHPDEERLILAYFDGDRRVERHLEACPACGARMAELRRLIAAVDSAPVPERGESYGREVWNRIAPLLEKRSDERPEPSRQGFFAAPRLAFTGVAAAVALAAFLAGRFWREPSPAPLVASPQASQRVLLLAVGDHLDRSEAVLVELINSPATAADAAREGARAEELLAANRLYRLSAAASGERALTDVLDELERVLLEVSHAAASASPEELATLRRRWEEGVLFKIRVLETRVRERGGEIAPRQERKRT
jgi:hypothetical protein